MRKGKIVIILTVLICAFTFLGMTPNTAQAEESTTSDDYFGMKWNFNEGTQTLTITGIGEMHDYMGGEDGDECPWWEWETQTKKIIIGNGITHIGGMAFWKFSVETISIPESVTSIGDATFYGCSNLESIVLPDKLKKIDSGAFGCTGLKKITIPNSVETMGRWVFTDCEKISSIILPKKLKSIPEGTFRNCVKLKSITIPNSVTKINANTFENSGIRSITIPRKVTTLKNELFLDCKYLKTITIKSSKIKNVSKDTFKGVSKKVEIKVPKKKLKTYKKMFYKAGLNCKVKIK